MAHRLLHEASGTAARSCRVIGPSCSVNPSSPADPGLQLAPDPVVGPVVDVLVGVALEVHALHASVRWLIRAKPRSEWCVDELRARSAAPRRGCRTRRRGTRGSTAAALRLGNSRRHMLRDPSAPTRTSQRTSCVGAVGVGEPHPRPVAGRGRRPTVSAHAEPDVAAVALAGVGEVDEHVGLRVEPAPTRRPGAWKSIAVADRRRSAARCPRARRRRAAPGRTRRESTSSRTLSRSRMPARCVSSISWRVRRSIDDRVDAGRGGAGGTASARPARRRRCRPRWW